jgi:hypothetical protein
VSKCKLWSPSRISPTTYIPQGCTLVIDGLHIFGVLVGFQDFVRHFLDDVLSQDVAHIDDLPFLGDAHVALDILSSYATHRPSYLTWIVPLSFSFLCFLTSFDKRVMQVCGDIMGPRSWESFRGPLTRRSAQLSISFGGISLLFMEDCAPSVFLGSWVLMFPYLCYKFYIFDRPVLEEYVS